MKQRAKQLKGRKQKLMINFIRINKYLSDSGICSRRNADDLILAGEIIVNGEKAKIGMKINPKIDKVLFKGNPVLNENSKIYIAIYKPAGIVSTAKSQANEINVLSLVKTNDRIYPVGRLDKDSEGLMILTNDGNLTKKLTHPSHEHEKEYLIYVEDETGVMTEGELKNKFETGLKINHKIMKVDKVFDVEISGKKIRFKILMHTGFNRQIRKMSAIIRLRVVRIIRTRLANLDLSNLNLKPGQHKEISLKKIL